MTDQTDKEILRTLDRVEKALEGLTPPTTADLLLLNGARILLAKLSLATLRRSIPAKSFKSPELEHQEER